MDRNKMKRVVELSEKLESLENLEQFLLHNPNFVVEIKGYFGDKDPIDMPKALNSSFQQMVTNEANIARKQVDSL